MTAKQIKRLREIAKPRPIESWLTPEEHSIKYRNLDRNAYLIVMAVVAAATIGAAIWILR